MVPVHLILRRLPALLLVVALTMLALPASAAEAPELYSTDYWEIAGPTAQITWVEIHNAKEAKASGIAHISHGKRQTRGIRSKNRTTPAG